MLYMQVMRDVMCMSLQLAVYDDVYCFSLHQAAHYCRLFTYTLALTQHQLHHAC